jgi:protein subunit release factor A
MSCIVECRPGIGGADAGWLAGRIADALAAWAARGKVPSETTTLTRVITVTLPRTEAAELAWLAGLHRI